MIENYISLRKAVEKKLLSEKDCVYVTYLLTIVLNKMQYESNGGGHFNVNPDMVLIYKKDGESVNVKLLGDDNPHEACNGKPDFNTEELNPCFQAPECFFGKFSSTSDVYSLGILLAYMLQGTNPYNINEKMSVSEILNVIKQCKPKIEVPTALSAIIYKAISRKSMERFKTAKEMGIALIDYLGMEKPKNYNCFSDGYKRNANEFTIKSNDMQNRNQSSMEPHLDVSMSVREGTGFKAVAGMEEIKKRLYRDFVEVISHRELAKKFGITPPNILLYGAPGTGKTYISMRLAEECGLDFCFIKPSDLGSIWLHGTQKLIKDLFQKAEAIAKKNKKGCILLVDEFDALCCVRDAKRHEHQADEVAEWLTQLNDCVEKNVFVIGTTNCLDRIDRAVIRHGRIDQVLYVGLPDIGCRKQLFELELAKRPHDLEINVDELARITEGYTSSDISYIVEETARNAFDASLKNDDCGVVKINEVMLRNVISSTRPSVSREEVKAYERKRDEFMKCYENEHLRIGFLA